MIEDKMHDFSDEEIRVRLNLEALARQSAYRGKETLNQAFDLVNSTKLHRQKLIAFYYEKVRYYTSIR